MEKSGGRKEGGEKPQGPPPPYRRDCSPISLPLLLSLTLDSTLFLLSFCLDLLVLPSSFFSPHLPLLLVQIMESSGSCRNAGMGTEGLYACGHAQKEDLAQPTTDLHWWHI